MSESMTYVARVSCGCLKAVVVDVPSMRREAANLMSAVLPLKDRGEIVERVTTESVRTMEWECEEHRKKVQP